MFNPRPVIRYLPIAGGGTCAVVDDFLAEPRGLVEHAVAQRVQFAIDPNNYYPGPELGLACRCSACAIATRKRLRLGREWRPAWLICSMMSGWVEPVFMCLKSRWPRPRNCCAMRAMGWCSRWRRT